MREDRELSRLDELSGIGQPQPHSSLPAQPPTANGGDDDDGVDGLEELSGLSHLSGFSVNSADITAALNDPRSKRDSAIVVNFTTPGSRRRTRGAFDLAYEITTRSSASRRAPSSAVSAALVHSLVALVHCRWHARLAKIA